MAKVVGCLGDIVFQVSSRVVNTFNKMQWSGSARYAEHACVGGHSLVEYLGVNPDKIAFDITLSQDLGVSIMGELAKIRGSMASGRTAPLIIGGRPYGFGGAATTHWMIVGHTINMISFDGDGWPILAAVTLKIVSFRRR